MDPISAARKLQKLLIVHDAVVKQIQELDYQAESISRQLFVSDLNAVDSDNSLHYMRHSTTAGVRTMLENCRSQLIQRVKKLSCQIIMSIQAEDTNTTSEQTDIFEQTDIESSNSSAATDTAAIQYTGNIRMGFRHD